MLTTRPRVSNWGAQAGLILKGNVGTAGDVGCHNSGGQGEGGCFWHQGPVVLLNNLQCKGQPPTTRTLQSQRQQHHGWEMLPQINPSPAAISRNPNHPIWNRYLPSLWPGSYPVTQVYLSCVCVCVCTHTCVCVCVCLVAQLCPTLCNPMDCSPPGSSIHGILQARTLKWVAYPFSSLSTVLSNKATYMI